MGIAWNADRILNVLHKINHIVLITIAEIVYLIVIALRKIMYVLEEHVKLHVFIKPQKFKFIEMGGG
jgi:hypothetical protein